MHAWKRAWQRFRSAPGELPRARQESFPVTRRASLRALAARLEESFVELPFASCWELKKNS
eukprot:8825996-Pyramimonas_sp.AAC.1